MNDDLTLAGHRVEQAGDVIRRFCGLPWSGGPPETWASPYYDATMPADGLLRLTDVTAAAALHPGLSRADLRLFHERKGGCGSGLTRFRPVSHLSTRIP